MLYKIEFEVDNGVSYTRDMALVDAFCVGEAEVLLRKYINSLDSETCIYKIFSIKPFEGKVFTGKHGCDRKDV